jgi:chromate transport protein ChrA
VLIGADLSGSRIAFYATAATVLPIIMLALGFQLRAQNIIWGRGPVGMKAAIVALVLGAAWIVLMGFGESEAFVSLAEGRNYGYHFVFDGVLVGISVLMLGTVDAVLEQVIESFRRDRDTERKAIIEQAVRTEIEKRRSATPPDDGES